MSETAYSPLDVVEDVFKKIVWDNLVQGGLAYVFLQVPALNLWPLRPVITSIVTMFADRLFAATKEAIDLEAIQFVNVEHALTYQAASVKLKILAHDRGTYSPEFIKARENAKQALSAFSQFGH